MASYIAVLSGEDDFEQALGCSSRRNRYIAMDEQCYAMPAVVRAILAKKWVVEN
ncbi:MAG: hypothetical protein ABIQ79_10575 [Nitrospiraceae bacterium]